MKFIRYKKDKPEYRGVLDGGKIKRISGSIFHDYNITDETELLEEVKVLPPVLPSKIIGLRKNYSFENKKLKEPLIFMKPASSVIAHNEEISVNNMLERVYAEAELAVIIGKRCRNVKPEHSMHYILGFTIANDVTGSSERFTETFTAGKYFDTFTPLGPVINTSCLYDSLDIEMFVNGELKQKGNTKDMIFNIPEQIAYLSLIMTLMPGDTVLTGTPSPAAEINDGDVIEIDIQNIGTLTNRVKRV